MLEEILIEKKEVKKRGDPELSLRDLKVLPGGLYTRPLLVGCTVQADFLCNCICFGEQWVH